MEGERKIVHKYTDKNHKPVPELKVGDKCYTTGGHNEFYWVSVCEIRKVEVRWHEFSDGDAYWSVNYYIRENVNIPAIKTTRMCAYNLDDEGLYRIYRTPQEAMDENIRYFKECVMKAAIRMRKTMRRLGYSEEQTKNLLEYKDEQDTSSNKSEAE